MKGIVAGIVFALTVQVLVGQSAPGAPPQIPPQISPDVRLGIVSDWTHHHVLYPDSKDNSVMVRMRKDPRWVQNWYLRHQEAWWPWWPEHRGPRGRSRRDWSVPLAASSATAFEPLFDFAFTLGPDTGYGTLNTTDVGSGEFNATAGFLTVTGGLDVGSYPLYPGGPSVTSSPSGFFVYDNDLFPSMDPVIDTVGGLSLSVAVWRSTSSPMVPTVIPFTIVPAITIREPHSS